MKILQLDPMCGIPVPPPAWGAIEKIVWEFKCNLDLLGHETDIKFITDIKKGQYDIVHCHVANLALQLAEMGIPYIYQLHDHHAYYYGKDSYVFKQNYEAVEKSLVSLMPANYLVDYFDNPKCMYFSHGVNTDEYKPNPKIDKVKTFLMLANNGLAGDPSFDRKGFNFGIALADMLEKDITIAGPENNKHWFNNNLHLCKNKNVRLIFDPSLDQVVDMMNTHKIFLNPTMLEAGHPNLTMLEAAACGLPIIADWEENVFFNGAWRAPRDVFKMVEGYHVIMDNYKDYSMNAFLTARELSWYKRSKELVKIYENYII
tara:strand:- start:2220 stop:3167 length:948 start_codon:yes stop_codon:yes gene_type:complete